jgi:quercetin 2,3-dioxygenase
MTDPGLPVNVSQMLGPLPSLLAAPSIWYAAVLVPNLKPSGSLGSSRSPTGTMCHVTVEIRRGSSRFVDRAAGRATWHSFSFGSHYDPARLGFGPMVCHDDHRLADGEGFAPHRHSGLVIVTWVLTGALTHTDSRGSSAEVAPGAVAVLRAGNGVEHSEVAAAPQTRFVQVWLTDDSGGEASYDVTAVSLEMGTLVRVAEPLPGSVFSVARLEAGQTVTLPASPLQHAFLGRGALIRSSLAEPLHDGDAFLFTDEPAHDLTAAVPTELLVWSFER